MVGGQALARRLVNEGAIPLPSYFSSESLDSMGWAMWSGLSS